jgi:hypothetical protein
MTTRNNNTNKANLELILYRLDELKESVDKNYLAMLEANERNTKAHSDNTLAIAMLEQQVAQLEQDFKQHFKNELPVKLPDTTDWAKVMVAIFGAIATIIAGYIAIKGS